MKKKTMFNKVYGAVRKKMLMEEGYENVVYLDSEGFPTVGIGHLVLPRDRLKLGQRISDERVEKLFKKDITSAINAAIEQALEVGEFEVDFVIALTSVNFQLGENWPQSWPNTYAKLKNGDFAAVIRAVKRSLWAKQTPKRTEAFIVALTQEMNEQQKPQSGFYAGLWKGRYNA